MTEYRIDGGALAAAGYGWLASVGVEPGALIFELVGGHYVADARIEGDEAVAYAQRVDASTTVCGHCAMVRVAIPQRDITAAGTVTARL